MKTTDVSESVMEKVSAFERRRSRLWLRIFWVTATILFVLGAINVWFVVRRLEESQTLDLLTLLTEDAEIIREFWQDTVVIFLGELPVAPVLIAALIVVGLGIMIYKTRGRRKVMRRRLAELAKNARS